MALSTAGKGQIGGARFRAPRKSAPDPAARETGRARSFARLLPAALLFASVASADAPPLPSSFFGDVLVGSEPAPAGTPITARLAGQELAATAAFARGGAASFRLDIPGDRAETPEVEGAVEGQAVEIRLGGALAAVVTWHTGTCTELPLAAAPGADLAITLDDQVTAVDAGGTVDFALQVTNQGPGPATGVDVRVVLPELATLAAASDGGAVTGGVLIWPPFELAEGAAAPRSFSVMLAAAVPAGLDLLTTVASVAHDGAGGADPDASDDQTSDVDTLLAEPDLAASLDDGVVQAAPGQTLVARLILRNEGRQDATGVVASVELPDGVELYSASHGGHLVGPSVSWPPVALGVAAEIARSVTVRIAGDLDPDVTALAFGGSVLDDGANGADSDPTDNLAQDVDTLFHAPDLAVGAVSTAGLTTDLATLELGGEVEVALANRGTLAAGALTVVLFADGDGDGDYAAAVDTLLGTASHSGLAAGGAESLAVAVAGAVRFRGERLFAKADPEDLWTELDETNNVGDSASECGVAPQAGPFTPRLELAWPLAGAPPLMPGSVDSLSTPIAVQLTDDNGDGRWDERDVPDIAFVTTNFYELMEPQIYLRAIRGDSGAPLFDVNGFLPHPTAPSAFSFSGLAAGDIDNDGRPELVTTTFGPAPNNVLIAFEHDGTRKWQSGVYHTHPSPTGLTNRDNPTIADLDADGFAEIVVGANVFDRFGHLLWRGTGGQAYQSSGNSGDRGGAISVAADVDLDGRLEVVTGGTLYRHDGEILWQVPLGDGYPAVADFDGDPQPEIVVVSAGTVRLHDGDGALLWGPVELPGSDPEAGGAPTVADFDGDGAPEVGVAGSDVYVVFETDGSVRWQASTQDYTSNLTGSTVFDFDGDGAFEVVYRDERRLRIYRGSDGAVLFEEVVSSNTWTEEPIVVDVDRDGNAEIVVTSDRAPDVPIPGGERTAGVRVYGDAGDGWGWARSIWNQHAYTPDQIEDDAGIPAGPAWGWREHNTFRANLPPGGDPAAAPNLTASRILLDADDLPRLTVTVRVGNAGRTPVGPGLPVAFYDGDPGSGGELLTVVPIAARLAPGEYVDLEAELALALPPSGEIVVAADDDGTGLGRERECDESDNVASTSYDAAALGLWIAIDDGAAAVAAGEEMTYRIEVANGFAGTAQGVVVTANLPAHALFVAASDGGTAAGATVAWPPVALASSADLVRSLTLLVDPDLPVGVASFAIEVGVSDDGGQGPEPSPWNNVAVDVDAVISVSAAAGGPYSGVEGAPIALDGSASSDRDGTIVAFDWDLDGDGEFDDASGPSASFVAADEGGYSIRLRVRDDAGESDVDSASVEVTNAPPVLGGLAPLAAEEGAPLSLAGVTVVDAGVGDLLSATVDWGEGGAGPVPVVAGAVVASHVYAEDGDYAVEVCVADGDGGEACSATLAEIHNAPPEIASQLTLDFVGWQVRELAVPASTQWDLSADGRTVTQRRNGEPALLVGDFPAFGRYELTLRVADDWDDDYLGLALGVDPAALGTPAADFLLVDWKRNDQGGARRGLALSRVRGAPSTAELWAHVDQAANGPAHRVEELARGLRYGQLGWARHTEYRLRVDLAPSRLRLWIDDALELDVAGSFPAGRLALYDDSQAGAIFTAVGTELGIWGVEGTPATLRAHFADPGTEDSHTAWMDWGDDAAGPVPLTEELGQGETLAEHTYLDDGEWLGELCVQDDDGGESCAPVPARIGNVAPHLTLAVESSGFREDPVTLDGSTFTDPGVLDLHSATVDWGDGVVESAAVVEAGGSGGLAATHVFGAPGDFRIRVCLDDGDGGVACEERAVVLVERALDLALSKALSVAEARPGERVTYTLQVANVGTLPATGVVLVDQVPEHLELVAASDGGVLAGDTVTWSLGEVAAGASHTRTLVADVAATAPYGTIVVNSAAVADDGASGPDGEPVNNLAAVPLRLSDGVTPIVTLPTWAPIVESGTLVLTGSRWSDTTAGEAHTASVDWGDGASGPASLTPAVGLGGDVAASHAYVEDGLYLVQVCVTDAAAHFGCAAREVTVVNAAPVVVEPGAVSLATWSEEEYPTGDPSAQWVVAADGLSVLQTQNSQPSIFFSPFPAYGVFLEGTVTVGYLGGWDDDFIGFVLGFDAGDTTDPEADFLLVDWKQWDQGNRRGLALSRVTGVATGGELWIHSGHVTELARGATLGGTNWREYREYRFRFEYSPSRVRIWVDDVLQFDLEGSFPDGNFGFYNNSQQDVRYRGFSSGLERRFEGERFELRAPFSDLGRLDSHVATVDWDDGASEPAAADAVDGFGFAAASHDYLDDGDFTIEACVEDDEQGRSCGRFPLLVLNRPPEVVAGPDALAVVGQPMALELARFTDPGRLDSHTAVVTWGDGASGPGSVVEDAGVGSVTAIHTWAATGAHQVEVCVTDDDGGSGCDTLSVEVLPTPPQIRAEKRVSPIDRDGDGQVSPGDDLVYRIEIFNTGGSAVTALVLEDPIPAHARIVPGTVTPSLLALSEDPVVVAVPELVPGAGIVVQFAVTIDSPLPTGVREIVNSGAVTSVGSPPVLTDDPELPGSSDPTRIAVAARPALALAKSASLVDLDGNGVATAGDEIEWRLTLAVTGSTAATGIVVSDPVPALTTLVAGSATVSRGSLLGLDPILWAIDNLEVGATAELAVRTAIAAELPGDAEAVVNQATVASLEVDAQLSDDPATPEPADPTRVPLHVPPVLSIAEIALAEGDAGVTPVTFALTLDRAAQVPVSVEWATVGGSATAGADFVSAGGTVTFAAGEVEEVIVVEALGDPLVELDETFSVALSNPVLLSLAASTAEGTLLNDDATALTVADVTVAEGATAEILLELTAPSALPIEVGWTTADLSAAAGTDYVAASGSVLFAPLATAASLAVETLADDLQEDDESFRVLLAAGGPVGLPDPEALVSILDGTQPCTLVCPDAIEVANDPGLCAAAVPLPAPTLSGDCGEVTCVPASGALFPLGATPVTCSSAVGGAHCAFAVTVLDLEPPVIGACPEDALVAAPPGALSWPYEFASPDGVDNCPELAVGCAPLSGSAFPAGATAVVCTATDGAGLSDSCAFDVLVAPAAIQEIPTLSARALMLFLVLLGVTALALLARRRG